MALTAKQSKKLNEIFTEYGAQFAYFFGSRATTEGIINTSDYDFAVLFGSGNERSRFQKRLRLHYDLEKLFAAAVDVVVLDDVKSITLRHEVIAKGQLIYDAQPTQRFDYEFRTLQEYDEFAPFLHAYNQAYMAVV